MSTDSSKTPSMRLSDISFVPSSVYLSTLKKGVDKQEKLTFIQAFNEKLTEAMKNGVDLDGKKDWHIIARYLDHQSFGMLLDGLDRHVLEWLAESKTHTDATFTHELAHYKAHAFERFWRKFSFSFQQRLVQRIDSNGSSVGHVIARYTDQDTFWPLWTDLGADAKENLAVLRDNNGWTLMHMIAEHQESETFDYIWLRLKKETQRKLIPIKTEEGYTIAELVKSYADLSEETIHSLGIVLRDDDCADECY